MLPLVRSSPRFLYRTLSTSATPVPSTPPTANPNRPKRQQKRDPLDNLVDPSILSTVASSSLLTRRQLRKARGPPPTTQETKTHNLRAAIDLYHDLQKSIPFNDPSRLSDALDSLILASPVPVPRLQQHVSKNFDMNSRTSMEFDWRGMKALQTDSDFKHYEDSPELTSLPDGHPRANWYRHWHRVRVMMDALHGTAMGGKAGLETVKEWQKADKVSSLLGNSEGSGEEGEEMEEMLEKERSKIQEQELGTPFGEEEWSEKTK